MDTQPEIPQRGFVSKGWYWASIKCQNKAPKIHSHFRIFWQEFVEVDMLRHFNRFGELSDKENNKSVEAARFKHGLKSINESISSDL